MMKYVFLDIDGVLNCAKNAWKFIDDPALEANYRFLDRGNWVETELLDRLIRLVKEENTKVVGVSSWFSCLAETEEEEKAGLSSLKDIENVLMLPIHDISHSTGGGVKRGQGVLSWLREEGYQEGVDSFVVIDDGGERYYAYPTVVVDARVGLSDGDIVYAKELLNHPMTIEECENLQKGYKDYQYKMRS